MAQATALDDQGWRLLSAGISGSRGTVPGYEMGRGQRLVDCACFDYGVVDDGRYMHTCGTVLLNVLLLNVWTMGETT